MAETVSSDSVAQDQLRAFVERIERLDEEIKAMNDDKREVFAEAKGNGFDPKAMKVVLKIRRTDHDERMGLEAVVDLYLAALGMQAAPVEGDDYEPRAGAGPHAREIIEEFDAETGEITETQEQFAAGVEEMRRRAATEPPTGELTLIDGFGPYTTNSTVQMQEGDVEGEGQAGVAREHGSGEPSQPLLPSDRVDETPDAPAVIAGAPILTPAAGGNTAELDSTGRILSVSGALDHKNALSGTGADPAVAADPDKSGGAAASLAPAEPHTLFDTYVLERHPFHKAFPDRLHGLGGLGNDIKANGVREPIIVADGAIVDGWARFAFARRHLLRYQVAPHAGADLLSDVIRWQTAHMLTMNERRLAAAKLKALPGIAHRASEIDQLLGLGAVETGRAA